MNKRDEGDKTDQTQQAEDMARPPGSLRRQFIGSLIGAASAFVVLIIGRQLGWLGGDLVQYLLWGGVIGGLVGGSDALAQAGRRLTGRDEDWLNILVSLVGMAVIFSVLFAIANALSNLMRGLSAR